MPNLSKVKVGDPLRFPASTYNALIDTVRDHLDSLQDEGRLHLRGRGPDSLILGVLNNSGADRDRFEVLGIAGPVIGPALNLDEFQRSRVFVEGVEPTAAHAGKFVILRDAIPASEFGRGILTGAAIVRVKMASEADTFADVRPGDSTTLLSGAAGAARLLWVQPPGERDPDPSMAWAIAHLGGAGGGSAASSYARITSKSGSSPPYRYAAVAAWLTDINGTWADIPDGAVYNDVWNLEEQGTGGQWVNPLQVGDIVTISQPNPAVAAYVCSRSHYRGTW